MPRRPGRGVGKSRPAAGARHHPYGV